MSCWLNNFFSLSLDALICYPLTDVSTSQVNGSTVGLQKTRSIMTPSPVDRATLRLQTLCRALLGVSVAENDCIVRPMSKQCCRLPHMSLSVLLIRA